MSALTLNPQVSRQAYLSQSTSPAAGTLAGMENGLGQPAPAGTVYGFRNTGVQAYVPIADKRVIEGDEQKAVQKGLSRWWPALFQNYGTSVGDMLANPMKSGIISGIGAALSIGLSTLIFRAAAPVVLGAGAIAGLVGGVLGYLLRKQQNGNVLDLMQRLPAGATKRDLLSDPVYQADLNRQAMLTGAQGAAGGGASLLPALAMGVAQGALNNSRSGYGSSSLYGRRGFLA